jgi:hypothetical protein
VAEDSNSGPVRENYVGSLPTHDKKEGYVKRTDHGSPCYI